MEDEAEKEKIIEQQQQDDDEQCDRVPKINLVYKGIRIKEFRFTVNLTGANTSMIVANFTAHIETRKEVIYSFKSEIYGGAGEIFQQNIN